jgi:CrcB protein
MMRLLVVGAGGFVGSVCRYLLSGLAQQLSGTSAFPVGTLTVNVVGCAVIGFLAYIADVHGGLSSLQRLFLLVGVLGGFTTFSAFANESMTLLQDGEQWYSLLNIVGHVVLCLGAVWIGRLAAYALWR